MNEDELIAYEQDRFEARYFGTMGPEMSAAFDLDLQQDQQLAERYHAFRMAMAAVEGSPESGMTADVKAHLAAIDGEMEKAAAIGSITKENIKVLEQMPAYRLRSTETQEELSAGKLNGPAGTTSHRWKWFAAAAAIIVSLLTGWWLLREPYYVQLADEFALPEPGLPVLMNDGAGAYDPIMNYLKTGRIDEARNAIDRALTEQPTNDTLLYFAGIVETRSDDCAKAIDRFRSVPSNSSYASKSRYHEAICHLRAGDKKQARAILLSLQNDTDPQVRDRALRLLAEL